MTGLRISDILQLSWKHIQMGQDGGYLIRLCTEKTEEETNLPISDETLALPWLAVNVEPERHRFNKQHGAEDTVWH